MTTNRLRNIFQSTKFSFGSTSAILTNMAIIIGMDTASNAKLTIVGSLLVIAVADNISDSLGIHIFQESEGLNEKKVWLQTITNFLSRLIISLGFVLIILTLPLHIAIVTSIIYGLLVLSVVSYFIALNKKMKPVPAILEHLFIAIIIISLSRFFGKLIVLHFK